MSFIHEIFISCGQNSLVVIIRDVDGEFTFSYVISNYSVNETNKLMSLSASLFSHKNDLTYY